MTRAVRLIAIVIAVSATGMAATVYSNTTTDTGDTLAYSANGFTQIGDQIQLAGTQRLATQATVQFFNDGTTGTFDATLRFFNVGAPVGSQIGSNFVVTGISINANDILDESWVLPGLLVPDNLIFTVSVANESAGVDIVGLDMFEPPTIGSSDPTFAIANDGTNFVKAPTANEDVFFDLEATSSSAAPEPATLGFAALGLLAVGILRPRKPTSA